MRFITLLLLTSLYFTPALLAQKKTHSTRNQINTPEQELAGFTVLEGFVIELVASERDGIVNPIDLTFDDFGRLWTQTAEMYPLDPVADIKWNDLLNLMDDQEAQKNHPNYKRILDLYQGKTKGTDKILILSNLYNKKPIEVTVWADGLTIPQSILPYKEGAYVAQGSELFFLNDTNNDGKADQRTPLLTGFGFTDTHTMSHVLVRAPGDWIHFSHGALNKGEVSSLHSDVKLRIDYSKIARFSMDAKKLELVSLGLNNIWGFQLRHNGQWYGSEANVPTDVNRAVDLALKAKVPHVLPYTIQRIGAINTVESVKALQSVQQRLEKMEPSHQNHEVHALITKELELVRE